MTSFLARGIDFTHHNYIVMDDLYCFFLFIKGDGYPGNAKAGWMSAMVNAGKGVNLDVYLRGRTAAKPSVRWWCSESVSTAQSSRVCRARPQTTRN